MVVILGIMAVVWIAFGDEDVCPSGTIHRSGLCCQDYDADGRCDVLTVGQQAPTGMTVQVVSGPSEEDVILAKLNAALKAAEAKSAREDRPGYQCDEFGCWKVNDYYDGRRYDGYRHHDAYYDDRYYGHTDEWDLKIIVKDDDTKDPVEDARVRIENGDEHTKYTDDDGAVKFRDIDEDCYDIDVSADDYLDETDYTCLHRDSTIRIYLEPRD
ncbi:MAG: carboxypeptidase regulatory-like domain-containing protein [DPANN group archaeon]|nr:carboxypeptidase regulatory-like domain-containing protein [DPANN group archaeon]